MSIRGMDYNVFAHVVHAAGFGSLEEGKAVKFEVRWCGTVPSPRVLPNPPAHAPCSHWPGADGTRWSAAMHQGDGSRRGVRPGGVKTDGRRHGGGGRGYDGEGGSY